VKENTTANLYSFITTRQGVVARYDDKTLATDMWIKINAGNK
jgi:hypothetical protein